MLSLYQGLLIGHVIAGAFALCLFWIPAFARKGSLNHKKFGRFYGMGMIAVAFTGIGMSVLVLLWPEYVRPELYTVPHLTESRVRNSQLFAWFLIHLGILIYSAIIYGNDVLRYKNDRSGLKRPWLVLVCSTLAINGLALSIVGLFQNQILLVVFGVLGMAIGVSNVKYIYQKTVSKKSWLREHLAAYIGSGIGAYTAFIVFGGATWLSATGSIYTALWIAPGVIGSVFIAKLAKKYDPPASKNRATEY